MLSCFYPILKIFLKKNLFFVYFLFILILLFTVLKINGSSVSLYYNVLNDHSKDRSLLFGNLQTIRGDEWIISTPLTISQINNKFNCFNKNVIWGQNFCFSYNIPSLHWSTFFKPYNWSYFIMPVEQAFAFRWWFRAALMIISIYLFLLEFTKKRYFISIVIPLVFFFTPFIQWQYDGTYALESITFTFLIAYFFIKILHYKKKTGLIIYTFFLIYSLVSFALMLYPPFALPLGLLLIFFLAGYILENRFLFSKKKLKTYFLACIVAIFIAGLILAIYYFSFKEIITTMANTSFPGERRIVNNGEFSVSRLLSGFFNIQLTGNLQISNPVFNENRSEVSNFFMFYPFLLPVILYQFFLNVLEEKKINFILLFLVLYLVISTARVLFGLPSYLSKALLFDFVPINRMIIGIGTANFILLVYFLNNIKVNFSKEYKTFAYFLSAFVFLLYCYFGLELGLKYPYFVNSLINTFFVSLVTSLLIFFLLCRKQKIFLSLLLLYSIISTYNINPIYKGFTDPLINTNLAKEVKAIKNLDKNNDRWVVYDSFPLSNYLIANGINSVNGSQIYPENNIWKEFDPKGVYYPVYNRYALISFSDNMDNRIEFQSPQPFLFKVKINPCNDVLKKLKVNYFIFNAKTNHVCLREVNNLFNNSSGFYIYKRI